MKKLIFSLIISILTVSQSFASFYTPSTQGSKFVFSFMCARSKQQKRLTLTISSPQAGVAKFTSSTGVISTQNINAGTTEILLAQTNGSFDDRVTIASATDPNIISGFYKDCYTTISNTVQNQGYTVETFLADGETPLRVSVFAGLSGTSTSDCANIYPIEVLGGEYYVLSRSGNSVGYRLLKGNTTFNNAYYPSEALIVAAEDNTLIDIYPSCLINGQAETDSKLSKISIQLNKGQTYLLQALSSDSLKKGMDDLTGTKIVATDDGGTNKCKRFAVFSGSAHSSGLNSPYNNGDYEYDQLFPTKVWGNNYITGSTTKGKINYECSINAGRDEIRIVASQPATDVYINNKFVKTLNAGEFYSHKDTLDLGTFVHSNKPVQVGLFTTGENLLCTDGSADGGPSLTVLTPLEFYLRDVDFSVYKAEFTSGSSNVIEHSLMLTALTSIREQTSLNGVLLTEGSTLNGSGQVINWTTIPSNPKYSQLIISGLDKTIAYNLKNNAPLDSIGGFTAILFSSQGKNAGYSYSIGAASRVFSPKLEINGISSDNISASTSFTKTINVRPILSNVIKPNKIIWEFIDDTIFHEVATDEANDFKATYTYSGTGSKALRMFVYGIFSDGCSSVSLVDTIFVNFNIDSTSEIVNKKEEISYESQIKVYPNPSSSFVQFSGFIGQADISIITLGGQIIVESQVNENDKLSIKNLAKGIYLFKVKSKDSFKVIRFIKE